MPGTPKDDSPTDLTALAVSLFNPHANRAAIKALRQYFASLGPVDASTHHTPEQVAQIAAEVAAILKSHGVLDDAVQFSGAPESDTPLPTMSAEAQEKFAIQLRKQAELRQRLGLDYNPTNTTRFTTF